MKVTINGRVFDLDGMPYTSRYDVCLCRAFLGWVFKDPAGYWHAKLKGHETAAGPFHRRKDAIDALYRKWAA